jgi:hypothetical protein
MHLSGPTYDVLLDGKLLGRINWTQVYSIPAGHHVLWVKEAPPYLLLPEDAQFPFDIASGETIHFTVSMGYTGYGDEQHLYIDRIQL